MHGGHLKIPFYTVMDSVYHVDCSFLLFCIFLEQFLDLLAPPFVEYIIRLDVWTLLLCEIAVNDIYMVVSGVAFLREAGNLPE